MYDFSDVEDVKQISAGVYKGNITLVKIAAEHLKKDDESSAKVVRFYLENVVKEGDDLVTYTGTITEMPLNTSWFADDPTKQKKEETAQMKHFMHILSAYIPEKQIKKLKAKDWEDFCEQVVKISGDLYKGETFQATLIYNNKGFLRFPKYTNPAFFLNSKSPSVVGISAYDKQYLEIPTPDAVVDDTEEPAEKLF